MDKPSKTFVDNRVYMLQSMKFVLSKFEEKPDYNKSHLEQLNKIYTLIKQNKKKQFLCLDINSADYAISYAKDIANPFDAKRRVITTLGRYVRRQLEIGVDVLPDVALDEFTNKANAYLKLEKDRDAFKVLSGKEILDYYRETTGLGSCMEGSNFFRTEIYALNPDKCQLLTFKKEGRALLWTCDDGTKYMDRIYGNNKVQALLLLWAKDNGYSLYKTTQTYKVTLKVRMYLPSIDTFSNFVWDLENKQAFAYSVPQYEPKKSVGVGLSTLTIPGVDPLSCKCSMHVLDEPEYKTADGKPICKKCKDALKPCPICNKSGIYLGSLGVCADCEAQVARKCANKRCQIKCNKNNMIKMKRPGATKICFACCNACMKAVNPDWVVDVNKDKDINEEEE